MLTQEQDILLRRWYHAVQAIAEVDHLYAEEMDLRKQVQALFFPEPKEGTSYAPLDQGYQLKLSYQYDRKVDEQSIAAVLERLRDEFNIRSDGLIRRKPELVVKVYKELPAAAKLVMDLALEVKPKSPTIEVVPPKKEKA